MEFPPYPNDDDQTYVYNLYHLNAGEVSSRPRAINFSSRKKMERHIVDMIVNNTAGKLDQPFHSAIYDLLKEQETNHFTTIFDRVVAVFRKAQLENSKPLGFDIYWDEEPQVLL